MEYYTKSEFEALGRYHANMYADIVHDPESVTRSYDCLITALIRQWHSLENIGYHFIIGDDAYSSSLDMFHHVSMEHRLIILDTGFTSDNMPPDHPMLRLSPITTTREDGTTVRLTNNDVFRGVHDMLGHYLPRNQFGAIGEYNAWLAHMASLPSESWEALFCETRGQNAWTNFADDHQDIPMKSRPFPEQKAGRVDMDAVFTGIRWPPYSHCHTRSV